VAASSAPVFSVLVLTEDGSTSAHATIEALAKKLLTSVDSNCHTGRVRFEPGNPEAVAIVTANRWKEKKAHKKQVDLVRTIAAKISESSGYVFFHFDADVTWKKRKTSHNEGAFKEIVVSKVERILKALDINETDREDRLSRLLELVPTYSIEAWLYQNTGEAIRISQQSYRREDVKLFCQWRDDRSLLDEVSKPKEQTKLKGKHNRSLAESAFPAKDVERAEKSWARSVARLSECSCLRRDIAATYHCDAAEMADHD